MGIKHRSSRTGGKRRSSSRRAKSQTRLESDRRKNERYDQRLQERRKESLERRNARIMRATYGAKPPNCPYCGAEPVLATHASGDRFWKCRNSNHCDAQVGCHQDTTVPMGTLANVDLRRARSRTHKLFDMLWSTGRMERTEAYIKLAASMGLSRDDAHIGMFTAGQCEEAAAFARAELRAMHVPIGRSRK